MIYLFTVPHWLKRIFKDFIWHINTEEKIIYLTFDDGPIPEVTPFVIDELAKYKAKATFFCVGQNIAKHPSIFRKIIEGGHSFGNHTFNHLKGWQTENEIYFQNIAQFEDQIELFKSQHNEMSKYPSFGNKKMLRPPYGRIKNSQAKIVKEKYKIIMWDVLTCDYDKSLSEEKCLKNAIKHSKPGCIVVFHDSLKSQKNLQYVLPKYLAHFRDIGYRFEALNV